jgi:hypothetical protein
MSPSMAHLFGSEKFTPELFRTNRQKNGAAHNVATAPSLLEKLSYRPLHNGRCVIPV